MLSVGKVFIVVVAVVASPRVVVGLGEIWLSKLAARGWRLFLVAVGFLIVGLVGVLRLLELRPAFVGGSRRPQWLIVPLGGCSL